MIASKGIRNIKALLTRVNTWTKAQTFSVANTHKGADTFEAAPTFSAGINMSGNFTMENNDRINANLAGGGVHVLLYLSSNDDVFLRFPDGKTCRIRNASNEDIIQLDDSGMTLSKGDFTMDGRSVRDALVKGFVSFDGTAGTLSADQAHNVAGLVDNGNGDYTVQWDVDFAAANYAVQATCASTTGFQFCMLGTLAAGTTQVEIRREGVGLVDSGRVCVTAMGALSDE